VREFFSSEQPAQLAVFEVNVIPREPGDQPAAAAIQNAELKHEALHDRPRRGENHRGAPALASLGKQFFRGQRGHGVELGTVLGKRTNGVMK